MITLPSSRADSFTFRPVPPGVKWSWMSASMTSLTEPRSAATVPIFSRTLSEQEPQRPSRTRIRSRPGTSW